MKRNKRNKSSGMVLITELIVVSAVMLILAAVAIPNWLQVRAAENQSAARDRLKQVARAQAVIAMCGATPGCAVPVEVSTLIPAPGTITQQGYALTYTANAGGWTYVAVPTQPGFSGNNSFYIDQTTVLRCSADASGQPC